MRGPPASSSRPTRIPATAETTSPAESAAIVVVWLQPVSSSMTVTATGSE